MLNAKPTIECDRYNSYNTSSKPFVISSGYEGIPQNLSINIVMFIILMIVFVILRKNAWNYGRWGWITNLKTDEDKIKLRHSMRKPFRESFNQEETMSIFKLIIYYLPLFIKISDKKLGLLCGKDAVIYCNFQRNLIGLVSIMVVAALTIVIPLNYRGKLITSNIEDFASLTIGNLRGDSDMLWGHFLVSVSILGISFLTAANFLDSVDSIKQEVTSTLMIENIPKVHCKEQTIRQYFKTVYPATNVTSVYVSYKYEDIIKLNLEREIAEDSLKYCYNNKMNKSQDIMVVPKLCGRLCLIFCCFQKCCCATQKCQEVPGTKYYSKEVVRLTKEISKLKIKVKKNNKLSLIFIRMSSKEDALNIKKDYVLRNLFRCLNSNVQENSFKEMESNEWQVNFAPDPNEIKWENIHLKGPRWHIPNILFNMLKIFIVFTFTTPPLVLNLMNYIFIIDGLNYLNLSVISRLIPPLILVLISSLLPSIIGSLVSCSRYWTITTEQITVMNQVYSVLVLCVLILPSLGLNSIPQLVQWLFPKNATEINYFRWECIFMPDGGALFCNYLITASFIGISFEYLRLGELFYYTCCLMCSKSRAEDDSIAKQCVWKFSYGLSYAWTLAIFTMISAYAVIVPLITIFGLIYLISKYLADRYNLIHAYSPTEVDRTIHQNAAILMQVALLLMQITVTVYVSIRSVTTNSPLPICCFIVLFVGLFLTAGRSLKRWLYSISWFKYSATILASDQEASSQINFLISLSDNEESDEAFHPNNINRRIRDESTKILVENLQEVFENKDYDFKIDSNDNNLLL